MPANMQSYEVVSITEFVVSSDGSNGALIVMECLGGKVVQLVLSPAQFTQLEGLLARELMEQAKLHQFH